MTWKKWQRRLTNNISMLMLKWAGATRHGELADVVGDAADAAPEQMNSFVQRKTEVFEKIEESLRPLCMVEDLNDDEIMELCVLSNELNACETTAKYQSVEVCVMCNEVVTP